MPQMTTSEAPQVRPLIDVIGLPSPETCRRLVVLLRLAEPREEKSIYAA
ncbi:hypothetical protein GCM10017673_33910 [Streptosporangium violaceochromogenes]|nr:hypothetical protein GCM10017673_33910 [Streptosporangium violaceochromogenes]